MAWRSMANVNDVNNTTLYCIQGTFTGFHRVFTEDEKFNNDDPQKFKDDYEGRIVISTGKIATDTTDSDNKDNTEWQILYNKEGITIEDALPKIELLRSRQLRSRQLRSRQLRSRLLRSRLLRSRLLRSRLLRSRLLRSRP